MYSELYRKITGKKAGADKALQQLPAIFTSPTRERHWVVVLDELDYLRSRKQEVLYNMFEWPNRANSHLIVIGIANTIDLIQRYLPPKIDSRIGTAFVRFGGACSRAHRLTRSRACGRKRSRRLPAVYHQPTAGHHRATPALGAGGHHTNRYARQQQQQHDVEAVRRRCDLVRCQEDCSRVRRCSASTESLPV